MTVCAIVAEYNPFHNGHLYHISKIRQNLQPDYVVAIMSGNFTQRGEPAIIDKFTRTKSALLNGADMVLELPVCYSTQPAEYFALGAVSILNASGLVTHLSFGSEAVNAQHGMIRRFSEWMHLDRSPQKNKAIGALIRQGLAYPAACLEAYASLHSLDGMSLDVLTKPNAILESAYIGALLRLKSKIEPYPVSRTGAGYHDVEVAGEIASATAIRKSIHNGQDGWMAAVPSSTLSLLTDHAHKLASPEKLYSAVKAALLLRREHIASLPDANSEMANNLAKSLKTSGNLDELIGNAATRRYSYARIARLLAHLLLDIDAKSMAMVRKKLPVYVRVLGIRKEASGFLGKLSKACSIPVITQPAGFSGSKLQQYMLGKDMLATDLYNACCADAPDLIGQDYTNKFISI